jgi:hypothetical protein
LNFGELDRNEQGCCGTAEWHKTTFVNYLRITFRWGGFPGWERDSNPPHEAIARLTEGLISI